MKNPKFSIIIPVYKVEKFIARSVESAVNQSFEGIEIICVDDCGGDKSMDIVREFAARDKRIKIVQNPQNLGTFMARNNGALAASGEYLLFLDADDSLELNACKLLNEALKDYEKQGVRLDILGFNYYTMDEKQETYSPNFYDVSQAFSQKEFAYKLFTHCWQGGYWCLADKAFLRQNFIKSLGLSVSKRLVMAEDALACFNALLYAKNCACLNERLYFYRENPNSIMQRKDEDKLKISIENHRFIIEKILELSAKFGDFERTCGKIFAVDLTAPLIKEQRKLGMSSLARLVSSLKKKIFKIRRKIYMKRLREIIAK